MKILKMLVIVSFILQLGYLVKTPAEELTFEWDPVPDTNIAGYRIFQAERQGNVSSPWVMVGETTITTFSWTVPDGKGFIFLVIAFDSSGNTSFVSNVALHAWRMGTPQNFRKQ